MIPIYFVFSRRTVIDLKVKSGLKKKRGRGVNMISTVPIVTDKVLKNVPLYSLAERKRYLKLQFVGRTLQVWWRGGGGGDSFAIDINPLKIKSQMKTY